MSDSDTSNVPKADNIFSSINILKISSDTTAFREWLRNYHAIKNDSELYQGYRYFILTSIKNVLSSLHFSCFNIERDIYYKRATFVGIPIEDIPNSCEEIILMKNIWNLSNGIQDSKDWESITKAINKLEQLFITFNKLYGYSEVTNTDFEKEYVLKIQTIFSTYIYFNETRRGFPQADIFPVIIVPKVKDEHFQNAFKGYVYTLQYLWFNLLGEIEFNNKCVKDLHKSITVKPKKRMFSIFENDNKIDEEKEWRVLDSFFSQIKNGIIVPLKIDLETHLVLPEKILQLSNKSLLKPFLSNNLKTPEYLTKSDKVSVKKKLNLRLLWYTVNVLDIKTSYLFNGVPTFIQAMIGSIELKKEWGTDEKTHVRIFKHPTGFNSGFDYSFGLLINGPYSDYADYSGWLIFYNCATDYSGSGGSNLDYVKQHLDKYHNYLDRKEIVVSKNIFKEYIIEKSIANEKWDTWLEKDEDELDDSDSTAEKVKEKELKLSESLDRQDFNQLMSSVKGKFLEYVFFKLKYDATEYDRIECDSKKYGQIDCIGYLKNSVDIFECKYALHSDKLNEDIDQLLNKRDEMIKETGLTVTPYIITYKKMNKTIKDILEENGIEVIDDFRSVIENANDILLKNSITDILNILDYEIR